MASACFYPNRPKNTASAMRDLNPGQEVCEIRPSEASPRARIPPLQNAPMHRILQVERLNLNNKIHSSKAVREPLMLSIVKAKNISFIIKILDPDDIIGSVTVLSPDYEGSRARRRC